MGSDDEMEPERLEEGKSVLSSLKEDFEEDKVGVWADTRSAAVRLRKEVAICNEEEKDYVSRVGVK